MAGCMLYCEAARSPVEDNKTKVDPNFPSVVIIVPWNFAIENVGMDDMSTGGHEANRDSVPLIGCTDMSVS